jgi:hypothetical protein
MPNSSTSAPRVFISYSHDDLEHRRNVADFAQALRRDGIDARIDQFVENDPPLSWPRWMADGIKAADFVLLIFTETYARRFEGREENGVGLGARWEGSIITSDLYFSQTEKVKFIPVVVRGQDVRFISPPLGLTNFYEIGTSRTRNLDRLLRHLHGQPALIPEELGKVPDHIASRHSGNLDSEVEELLQSALDLAANGEQSEAERKIFPLLDSSKSVVAAHAAYTIGRIRLHDEQYSASINAFRRALEKSDSPTLSELIADDLRAALAIMNSHFGEGGPVEAGRQYLQLVKRGDMQEVWRRTEPTLRLILAQAWIWANRSHPGLVEVNREELAASLSDLRQTHHLKEDFFATQLREMQDAFQGYDEERWGAAEKPRRFGMDYELIIFMETAGEVLIFQEGMSPPSLPLLMRRIGPTWMVANFVPSYPVPGWPPTTQALPNLELDIRRVVE